jgi:threonine dehydrogenase-like Zn-dependent dehydrogenase
LRHFKRHPKEIGSVHMKATMTAAFLPGNSTVELRTAPVPSPGHGEVLLRVKASTICGSDIRCIYHEHVGKGPEGYQDVIAGHEPSGRIVAAGEGCRRFKVGDRVIVYHISGCGVCNDCRRGYMISCSSEKYRRAYGWQRDGGMAEYMVAEEKDLIALPDELSYADGAQVACGFGTVYEGLEKIGINGDHAVLITGLGPVGLATGALCRKLGAQKIIGIDVVPERMKIALDLGLCDVVLGSGPGNVAEVKQLTGGMGVERAVDCSANEAARATAIRATRKWGKIVFLGEGGRVEFNPSPDSRAEDALRLVGHVDVADGRAGRAASALESASGRHHHAPVSAGARQRGLCADGHRQMRQGGRVRGRRTEVES